MSSIRLPASRIAGLVALLCLAAALPVAGQEPQASIDLDAAPTHPAADAIDDDRLNAAAAAALRNAVASLVARQAADGNETDLIYPPLTRRTVVDHKETTRRYRRVTVVRSEPVYEIQHGYRMEPKKDEYGHIVGYERKRYVKKRIKVGEKQVKREVLKRDPDGPIKRTHRKRIYGKGGPDYVPRGLIGLNSMALYVMTRAGLVDSAPARDLANDLARHIETYALPDHTFDLAWAAAAFAAYPYSDHEDLQRKLISKVIDGQVRERQANGMWGPVSIHYDLLARYMIAEIKLYQEMNPLQTKLQKIVDVQLEGDTSRADARNRAILERKLQILRQHLEKVTDGLEYASVLGNRFTKVQSEYREDKEWGKAGLPYYIYNRILVDMEATSLAAFAIAEAAKADRLPDATPRPDISLTSLPRPQSTRSTLMDAARRIVQKQARHGGWDEGNQLIANTTFNRFGTIGVQGVPFRGQLPQLPSIETMRSNLDGYAALSGVLEAFGDRAPAGFANARARAADHVLAILEALADKPIDIPSRALAYAGETDKASDVARNRGQITTETPAVHDPTEMPVAFLPDGADVWRGAFVALRTTDGLSDEQVERLRAVRKRLAYRLLLSQGLDGQWSGRSHGRAATSSLRQYLVVDKGPRIAGWVAKHPDKDRPPRWWRDGRRRNIWRDVTERDYEAPNDLYSTLAAALVLSDFAREPITLDEVPILPPKPDEDEIAAEGDEGEEAVEEEDAEPLSPGQAAASVERVNGALLPLVQSIIDAEAARSPEEPAPEAGESAGAKPEGEGA